MNKNDRDTWYHIFSVARCHRRVRIIFADLAARLLGDRSFFLQARMDIDRKSPWYDPRFIERTGGFFPLSSNESRSIAEFEPHDLVRRDMLVLLMRSLIERNITGAIADLGVYRGMTAKLLHHYMPDRKLLLFDTFSGFHISDIRDEEKITGLRVPQTHFTDITMEQVLQYIAPLNGNVLFYPGHFPETCDHTVLNTRFCLVHLDMDLYRPTKAALELLFERVVPGGFIVIHDYNAWPGPRQAADEFFMTKSETLIPMPDKSGSAVILKT